MIICSLDLTTYDLLESILGSSESWLVANGCLIRTVIMSWLHITVRGMCGTAMLISSLVRSRLY